MQEARVVAYGRKEHEKNYHTYNLELPAMVFAFENVETLFAR